MAAFEIQVSGIYIGTIEAMIAEVSAHDMGEEWFTENGYKFAVMPVGNAQFDTSYHTNYKEALEEAKDLAVVYNTEVVGV